MIIIKIVEQGAPSAKLFYNIVFYLHMSNGNYIKVGDTRGKKNWWLSVDVDFDHYVCVSLTFLNPKLLRVRWAMFDRGKSYGCPSSTC